MLYELLVLGLCNYVCVCNRVALPAAASLPSCVLLLTVVCCDRCSKQHPACTASWRSSLLES